MKIRRKLRPTWFAPGVELYLGDCMEVLPRLPKGSVDAIVTSPPYAMQRAKQYGGVPEEEYPAWTVGWCNAARSALTERGSIFINIRENIRNGQISDYVHRTRLALREASWVECEELIWVKRDGAPVGSGHRPRRSWERILWFAKTGDCLCMPKQGGNPAGSIREPTGRGLQLWRKIRHKEEKVGAVRVRDYVVTAGGRSARGDWLHPAVYPVEVPRYLIRLVTEPGHTVCDPFTGSGTTGVAAVRKGRRFVGIEIKREYLDISVRRLAR